MTVGSVNGAKGRRHKSRLIRITFEPGHDLEDLEVMMRPASVDDLMELSAAEVLAQDVADGTAAGAVTEAHRQAVAVMVGKLADLIVSWNHDGIDGNPVTPDEAGLRGEDFAMVFAIFEAFTGRLTRVPPPLPQGSPGGPDLSGIPVETLSPASLLS